MFYLDVTTDVVRLFFYLVFFLVVTMYYGLPLHLVRELYMTIYNLRDRVTKFIHYRKLTRNMNERFPDATPEELQAVTLLFLLLPFSFSLHCSCLHLVCFNSSKKYPSTRAIAPALFAEKTWLWAKSTLHLSLSLLSLSLFSLSLVCLFVCLFVCFKFWRHAM